jgi:hypothetical protein
MYYDIEILEGKKEYENAMKCDRSNELNEYINLLHISSKKGYILSCIHLCVYSVRYGSYIDDIISLRKRIENDFEIFYNYAKKIENNECSMFCKYIYNDIGLCFFYGIGTKKNIKEGIYWIKKSAEKDYIEAQFLLGKYYYNYKKYCEKAIYW